MKLHQPDLCLQLGREIKTLRHWMGFNQEDLAKSLNISRSALVRCEQGKVPFNKKIYDAAKKFLVLDEPSPFFNKPLRSDKTMTTFTSEDRQEAYQKKVEEAPYHPGYEDAVVTIKETKDVADTPFAMAILDDKFEIAMYGPYHADFARDFSFIPLYTKPQLKPLSDEEICYLWKVSQEDSVGISLGYTTQEHYFARLIEERHGIK